MQKGKNYTEMDIYLLLKFSAYNGKCGGPRQDHRIIFLYDYVEDNSAKTF